MNTSVPDGFAYIVVAVLFLLALAIPLCLLGVAISSAMEIRSSEKLRQGELWLKFHARNLWTLTSTSTVLAFILFLLIRSLLD